MPTQSPAAKRGGRPKHSALERRTHAYTPRFNDLHDARIKHDASLMGISPTDCVHKMVVSVIEETAELSIPARRSVDPQLITKLDKLAGEVRDLGQVVNQVATYLHTDRSIPYDMEQLAADIQRLKASIDQTLEQAVGI